MLHQPDEWPSPPTNVRIVLVGGDEVPVDCRYLGRDEQGIDQWDALVPERYERDVRGFKVDVLPAKCAVGVAIIPPEAP